MIALLHDFLRYLIRHIVGRRAFLTRVSEYTHFVEAHFFEEVAQRLVLGIRLARKTNEERRADRHAWDTFAQFMNELAHIILRIRPTHAAQHCVMCMLQWQIDVFA